MIPLWHIDGLFACVGHVHIEYVKKGIHFKVTRVPLRVNLTRIEDYTTANTAHLPGNSLIIPAIYLKRLGYPALIMSAPFSATM